MTWARIDDKLHSHAATLAAGNEAMGLWVRCESYCADHGTDGHVPWSVVELFAGGKSAAKRLGQRLVDAGVWVQTTSGFASSGYVERNQSRGDMDARRTAETARKQAQRARVSRVCPAPVPVGQDRDNDACPAPVPVGQSNLSRPCPENVPTSPSSSPPTPPLSPSPRPNPGPGPARARVQEPPATWPSPEHQGAAERYLAALEERTGRPAQYRASALAALAVEHADTFVAACDDACNRDVGWQGWHVSQPRNWLRTLCGQVGEERARASRPGAKSPPTPGPTGRKGGYYGDGYDGPKQIGELR